MNKYTAMKIKGKSTYNTVLKCLDKVTELPVAMKKLRNVMNTTYITTTTMI